MDKKFDKEKAKHHLSSKEEAKKQALEAMRKALLVKVSDFLKIELKDLAIEVYLVGSILHPFGFSPDSDIDIVLKNYHGDRFDLWTKLEKEMGRKVEIIIFETCHFQEFVLKEGLKIL